MIAAILARIFTAAFAHWYYDTIIDDRDPISH
jgi:hypothetical protein